MSDLVIQKAGSASDVITKNNNNDIQLNAYIVASNISDQPTEVSWTTVESTGPTLTLSGPPNTLNPIASGFGSGNYRLRVMAVSATSSSLLEPITDYAYININVTIPVAPGPIINTGNQNKFKGITYSVDDSKISNFTSNTTLDDIQVASITLEAPVKGYNQIAIGG